MDLSQYYVFGLRPVKTVSTEDGGMEVFAYNWKTGEFEVALPDYLVRALTGLGDVDKLTEAQFEQYVKDETEREAKITREIQRRLREKMALGIQNS
jgi:hypothetical protein